MLQQAVHILTIVLYKFKREKQLAYRNNAVLDLSEIEFGFVTLKFASYTYS